MNIKDIIRTIPDYPKPGIMFRDVTTLFGDARAFRTTVDMLVQPYAGTRIDKVAGIEARGFVVGGAVWLIMLLWPGVSVTIHTPWAVLWFGLMGSMLVALLGMMTSIWAEKFDHAAAVSNFVIAPLSLLSGTFYSVDKLSPVFQTISHANPFFYIISGFRYGFLGRTDSNVMLGAVVLLAANIVFGTVVYLVLKSGWKLKN